MKDIKVGDFVYVAGEGPDIFQVSQIEGDSGVVVRSPTPEWGGYWEPIRKMTKISPDKVKAITTFTLK